jgi:predicted nuclease of predicted toxin-antitoxin system
MRILLDESLPRSLRGELTSHSVKTVAEMGWSAIENGELLRRATEQFDVLVTADQNLQFQQNMDALPISVIVLAARTNRLDDLRPLIPELLARLGALAPKTFWRIGTTS